MAVFYQNTEVYNAGTGNLFLFLKVGMWQYYNSFVRIGKKKLVSGQFEALFIGPVQDCKNNSLVVEINATDTNEATNTVPVSLQLKDDQNDKVYEYAVEADKNGGTILFEIKFSIK